MANVKTRLQRLEKSNMTLHDMFLLAARQFPPEASQRAAVDRVLGLEPGMTIEDMSVFEQWHDANDNAIAGLFDKLKPGWRKPSEDENRQTIAELVKLVLSGEITLEDVGSLFPDLLNEVQAKVAAAA